MKQHARNGRAGFTLVELMVVAIIVAILASVAIPLMSGNKKRALGTEAEATLGTLRTQLRIMYAETSDYTRTPNGRIITAPCSVTNIPGVIAGDIQGRYWNWDCYTIDEISVNTFKLKAEGVSTNETQGLIVYMTEGGVITREGF